MTFPIAKKCINLKRLNAKKQKNRFHKKVNKTSQIGKFPFYAEIFRRKAICFLSVFCYSKNRSAHKPKSQSFAYQNNGNFLIISK
jgi:hypothetical protein